MNKFTLERLIRVLIEEYEFDHKGEQIEDIHVNRSWRQTRRGFDGHRPIEVVTRKLEPGE